MSLKQSFLPFNIRSPRHTCTHIYMLHHPSLHSGQVCVKVSGFTILILANFPLKGYFFLFLKAQFEKGALV